MTPPEPPPVRPGKNAILSESGMDDWLVIDNYTGTGQPEGSFEEWRSILSAMKDRENNGFKRIAVHFDSAGNAWFCSPRNSMDSYSASVKAEDVDEWIKYGQAITANPPATSDVNIAVIVSYIQDLKEGERVVECGVSGMTGTKGTVYLSKSGDVCVCWDSPKGMGTSATGGTRRISDVIAPEQAAKPEEGADEAKYINWTLRKRSSSGAEYSTVYSSKIGPCTRLHVLASPSVKGWLGDDVYLGIGPTRLEEAKPEAATADLVTCPASRHVAMIADCLGETGRYIQIEEDPQHCAGSMRSVVESLWQSRSDLAAARAERDEAKPWMLFFRDQKTLGQIAEITGRPLYDFVHPFTKAVRVVCEGHDKDAEIQRLRAALESATSDWTKIDDADPLSAPQTMGYYLAASDSGHVDKSFFSPSGIGIKNMNSRKAVGKYSRYFELSSLGYKITHWRPLPAAPEAKQGEGRAE